MNWFLPKLLPSAVIARNEPKRASHKSNKISYLYHFGEVTEWPIVRHWKCPLLSKNPGKMKVLLTIHPEKLPES